MTAMRYIFGFVLGGIVGLLLAFVVAAIIGMLAPAEHALRGFAGVIVSFIAIPAFGLAGAVKFGRAFRQAPSEKPKIDT